MADTKPFTPNPFANFDPSQWSNPYSQYSSGALPWPAQYAGTPTDAYGQPIQATPAVPAAFAASTATPALPGTTINSSPQYTGLGGKPSPSEWQAANNAANPDPSSAAMVNAMTMGGALDPSGSNMFAANPWQQQRPQAPLAQAAPQAANSYQSALSALANPGPLKQFGATVPQSSGVQPGGGVLQNFLNTWQPQGGSGPGAGFTKAFSQALRGK